MRIEITQSAADDIADGHLFYESREAGVGYYFEIRDVRYPVLDYLRWHS